MQSFSTPRCVLILFTLILLASTLHAQPAGDGARKLGRSLRDQANVALGKGEKQKAAELLVRWLEADPQDESSWYNLACLYALLGEKERALDALERSVDAGWRDPDHPRRDTDLDAIRSDPRFDRAIDRVKSRLDAETPHNGLRGFAPMTSRGTYLVLLPPDYDSSRRDYPLCLILHGSGSSEMQHGKLADRFGREGVIYLAPRAPYPHLGVMLSGGGTAGYDAWPPERLPEGDSLAADQVRRDYVDWIFTAVHDVQRNYRVRKGKIFIYGHSQGGGFATLSALMHPEEVGSFLTEAGSLPPDRFFTTESLTRLKSAGVQAHILHGSEDNVVKPDRSEQLAAKLKGGGVQNTLTIIPGDHSVSEPMITVVKKWIAEEVRR